jgi:hypothetical protein
MPTLSQYWFQNSLLGGPFDVYNVPYADGGWAWVASGAQSAATLAWNRPDNEQTIDLAPLLNAPATLSTIDQLLGSQASRTSALMAQARFYWQVPYYSQDPARHNAWDMLARLYFDFHISTPWYCSDASGDISYYVMVYLDSAGHLGGYVDGWSYNYSGGGPFCTGAINDALNSAIPAGISPLQELLNSGFALLGRSSFSYVYLLPGDGTKSAGETAENADTDAAIAAVP